jgi:hypothetical protein
MIVRINKIATDFEMCLFHGNHHGCFVVYFLCIVKLVRKVIFIMLFQVYPNIYPPAASLKRPENSGADCKMKKSYP